MASHMLHARRPGPRPEGHVRQATGRWHLIPGYWALRAAASGALALLLGTALAVAAQGQAFPPTVAAQGQAPQSSAATQGQPPPLTVAAQSTAPLPSAAQGDFAGLV